MSSTQSTDELLFVGKKEDLISAQRTVVSLQGRDVLIIYHEGEFYAIDSYCYHSGSSLETGDIEELNNKLCIICPKHKYKISLCDGEGLYRARDRSQSPPPLRWFSKGVKQRVHPIIEIQGELYLRPATSGYIESDYYQGEQGKVERERAALRTKGGTGERGHGGGGGALATT
ncbi:hypothetical protein NQD34_003485 [Periophthalmus magnuspinnatus]|nr:hypothetical protein NQD34_003485 [Periophthalmus magnuspinnatus]